MIIINRTAFLNKMNETELLKGQAFTSEDGGHQFVITCRRDGEDVALSGTVTGRFIRDDGVSVQLTPSYAGITEDGKAWVILPANCYTVRGQFVLVIFYTDGDGHKCCIYSAAGYVRDGVSEQFVDPENVIDVDTIHAMIGDLQDAIEDAQEQATSSVQFTAQSLTDAQKGQARTNIGAGSEADVSDLMSATGDLSGLSTDNKSSLVSAVNEINGHFLDGIAEGVADWLDEHPDAADTPTPLLAKNILRVGCIGDSYINGSYAADGTQIAWPYFMEKMTGHTWMNFGCSGSGAKTWIEGPSDLTRLSEVQNEEKKCQAYIIGLGLNDCKPGLTTYAPVGTASDIGTTANSYYAYYYRLVQAVHAVNDRAPIFCLTCPYPDSIHDPYNAAVRAIVEYCRNAQQPVFLGDLAGDAYNNSRFFKNPIFTLDRESGHYSTLGQEMMAECLMRVISDVMMTNISAFRGIMSVPFSLDTIGGFNVLVNGAKFGGRDGAIDDVIEDSSYCIVGWFDSGSTGSKSYTLFSPDSTGGIIRFFNDKTASSVDFWSFSANAARTVTASGRYIAFHVKKSLAGNYYVYDNTNNKFIAKGNLVT